MRILFHEVILALALQDQAHLCLLIKVSDRPTPESRDRRRVRGRRLGEHIRSEAMLPHHDGRWRAPQVQIETVGRWLERP